MSHSLRTSLSQADIARLLFGPAYEETATGLNLFSTREDSDPPAAALPAATVTEPQPAYRSRSDNFVRWTTGEMDARNGHPGSAPDVCPTCLTAAPTSWRYGKVSQSMVCQPCSLYERRNGTQRTPEMAAMKKGDGRR
ncbi:hypothetical protein HMN09_01002800 [Mycena chlorophos]|uniref:GATA-type domain-containing protein n=1 Tax=Mycena chlorophos TaxID=658473 RepID=A0A8H6W5F8_MYCCL|nr:hypothetical protein HMN09_01002800 [Mycena chlorophos]